MPFEPHLTKAVIHQPYFLPWMGYFSKLIYADKFIILDDVDFTKRGFIDRVQIINSQGEPFWIGLPIGQRYKEKCNCIEYTDKKPVEKIIKSFYSAYSKARHFKNTVGKIESIILSAFIDNSILSEINLQIVVGILNLLDFKLPEIVHSSKFSFNESPTDRIIELFAANGCNTLITGSGGSLEAHDTHKIARSGINIYLQDYYKLHPTYYQTRRKFLGFAKGLSIVDCIFNEGLERTKEILCNDENIPKLILSAQ